MRRDILTFLLFVVLAALIWYGHAMQSVRNTKVPVLIQYTKPNQIGLGEGGLPATVMVEVRDAGSRLNTYHREPLHLTIDLRPYIHGEKGTIHVPSDALRRSVSDILQGTSRLINTDPEELRCSYFTEQEKRVVIAFAGDIRPAAEYQQVGEPTLRRNTIKIYGQDKVLQTIDTIYTVADEWMDVMDTTERLIALDIPEGIRAERDSVQVQCITERFTERKFTIPIHVTGVPEGYHIRLFPHEVEVSVRVGMAHYAKVSEKDIHAICTYTPERMDKMEVSLQYKNPYISSAWVYPGVVEFIIEQ